MCVQGGFKWTRWCLKASIDCISVGYGSLCETDVSKPSVPLAEPTEYRRSKNINKLINGVLFYTSFGGITT